MFTPNHVVPTQGCELIWSLLKQHGSCPNLELWKWLGFKNKSLFGGGSTSKWNSYPTMLEFQGKSPIMAHVVAITILLFFSRYE